MTPTSTTAHFGRKARMALAAGLLALIFAVSAAPALAVDVNVGLGATCAASDIGKSCGTEDAQRASCQEVDTARIVCRQAPCSDTSPCPSGMNCADLSASGSSYKGCIAGASEGSKEQARPITPIKPTLEINIPTISLSDAQVRSEGNARVIDLPWISEYIVGIYQYAVFAGSVIATVMMMVGGFQWLTAGGNSERVGKAKSRISDATVGLVLLVGTYTVLKTINPDLVSLPSLQIEIVERNEIQSISGDACASAVGEVPTRDEMREMVRQVAEDAGLDVCEIEAVIGKESGYRTCVIGHDENAPRTQVASRPIFIRSGVKFSGETFPPNMGKVRVREFANDDNNFNPNDPPDYGLDKRFSHGIGLGQITINLPCSESRNTCTETRCPGGELGQTIGGRCYTVVDLLDPQKNMEFSVALYRQKIAACPSGDAGRLCRFYKYAGSGCSARLAACRKMKAWSRCSGTGNNEISECRDWIADNRKGCTDRHMSPDEVPASAAKN